MLGHAAIAETALADVGGVLQVATVEMNALATSSSVGSGTLVGISSLSGNFTQTTEVNTKASGVIDLSSIFTQTTEDIKIVNYTVCRSKCRSNRGNFYRNNSKWHRNIY